MIHLREVLGGYLGFACCWVRLRVALLLIRLARDIAPASLHATAVAPGGTPVHVLAVAYHHVHAAATVLAVAADVPETLSQASR